MSAVAVIDKESILRNMSKQQANMEVTDERHILAERFKTKLCKNYVATGMCPYESRCMFAHGEEDRRTAEMNMRDGLYTEEAIKAYKRAKRLMERQSQPTVDNQYDYDPNTDYCNYNTYHDENDFGNNYDCTDNFYPPYEYYDDESCSHCDTVSVGGASLHTQKPQLRWRYNPYTNQKEYV